MVASSASVDLVARIPRAAATPANVSAYWVRTGLGHRADWRTEEAWIRLGDEEVLDFGGLLCCTLDWDQSSDWDVSRVSGVGGRFFPFFLWIYFLISWFLTDLNPFFAWHDLT